MLFTKIARNLILPESPLRLFFQVGSWLCEGLLGHWLSLVSVVILVLFLLVLFTSYFVVRLLLLLRFKRWSQILKSILGVTELASSSVTVVTSSFF